MAIIPRHVVRFRDLKIGDHFKFAGGSGWSNTAKKISSRCYVWGDRRAYTRVVGRGVNARFVGPTRAGLLNTCVGSVNVPVEYTGRSSPVKRRRGRGRGPGKMAGYRRRR